MSRNIRKSLSLFEGIKTIKMTETSSINIIGTKMEKAYLETFKANMNDNGNNNNPQKYFDNDDSDDDERIPGIKFVNYRDESQLHSVMTLVGKDLSEPYSGMEKSYHKS